MNTAINHPQYITDDKGHKTAVILPIDAYTELMEDLSDLAIVAERRSEPTISFDKLLSGLKADGII